MRILYNETDGFVLAIPITEPEMMFRAMGALIESFKDDCDVSFLRECVKLAEQDLKPHTVN